MKSILSQDKLNAEFISQTHRLQRPLSPFIFYNYNYLLQLHFYIPHTYAWYIFYFLRYVCRVLSVNRVLVFLGSVCCLSKRLTMNGSEWVLECECVCTLRLKVLSFPCSRRELVDFRYKVVVVVETYLRNQTTKIVEIKRTNGMNTSEG